jgi:alkylation response protein AidB-like acyl-CoA dehydrogenase
VPFETLSDEQREIRDLVRTLARERIAPRAAEIDESHEFPWDIVELYREHGLFGLFFDDAYGGLGTGTLLALIAIEEVSKVCATSGLILAVQELGSLGLKLAGSDEQKERYLPKLASGEWLAAYALTESGSGSDSAAMRTTARADNGEYVLNGSKRFITNADVANLYTVFAKTDPEAGHAGISAFVVEADTPGFEVARLEPKLGMPIAEHQLIAAKLADMETACEAARGLLYAFGQLADAGLDGSELTKASAQAKLFCSDTAMWVTTEAVQILGGYGYIREYPVERMMRDAKITQIYEGTNEIQRLVIAREMLRENRVSQLTAVG